MFSILTKGLGNVDELTNVQALLTYNNIWFAKNLLCLGKPFGTISLL